MPFDFGCFSLENKFIRALHAILYPLDLFPENPGAITGITGRLYFCSALLHTALISSPITPTIHVEYTNIAFGLCSLITPSRALSSFFSPPKITSCSLKSVEKLFLYISSPLDRLPLISQV